MNKNRRLQVIVPRALAGLGLNFVLNFTALYGFSKREKLSSETSSRTIRDNTEVLRSVFGRKFGFHHRSTVSMSNFVLILTSYCEFFGSTSV